jgi:DNA-binding FadR family transcriptional regulator
MGSEKRLYQGVLKKLQQLIDSGEYPAGGRLPPERELAGRFGVSRPTIREAIIALEVLGRVEVKTGSGVYVLASSADAKVTKTSVSAFELTEARALIEGEAVALAATMITDEQLDALEAALHEMANESADGKLISETADKEFHHIISQATKNKMLATMIDSLWYVRDNSPTVHQAYQSICEIDGKIRVQEHQEIFDALKNRNGTAARTAMHAHFSRILNKLIAVNEAEQVEAVRKQALESRERFSLNHLVSEA